MSCLLETALLFSCMNVVNLWRAGMVHPCMDHPERCPLQYYYFHYLDDFLVMGPQARILRMQRQPGNPPQSLCRLRSTTGPWQTRRILAPLYILTFLGITINTLRGELRLPVEKLQTPGHNKWMAPQACMHPQATRIPHWYPAPCMEFAQVDPFCGEPSHSLP